MRSVRNLELHVAHSCNLQCESCSHFSNHNHKGLTSLSDADSWMSAWQARISPATFSLLGGEPTIHSELPAFVPLIRRHWGNRPRIRIVSNGFLLHRHPSLPKVLAEHGPAILEISVHHESRDYLERLRPVLELVSAWRRDHGIEVRALGSARNWTRRYHGFGKEMMPFDDGEPRSSWEACPAKYCRQLFEGKMWKCSPIAYLPMQHAKFGLSDAWQPYLGYRPLDPSCTDAELDAFLDREEEAICGMCPSRPERFSMPLPFPSQASFGRPRTV
jgi:hypothetical protein